MAQQEYNGQQFMAGSSPLVSDQTNGNFNHSNNVNSSLSYDQFSQEEDASPHSRYVHINIIYFLIFFYNTIGETSVVEVKNAADIKESIAQAEARAVHLLTHLADANEGMFLQKLILAK